jgi:hypothetical protein
LPDKAEKPPLDIDSLDIDADAYVTALTDLHSQDVATLAVQLAQAKRRIGLLEVLLRQYVQPPD